MALKFHKATQFYIIDQNMQNTVLISNSKTTWPTKILMT